MEEEIHIIQADFKDALKKLAEQQIKFDLIFLDPPYQDNLIAKSLELLEQYHLCNDGAMLVCEFETEQFKSADYLYKDRKYGSKYIQIYIKNT